MEKIRRIDSIVMKLPLPNINPNKVSGLSVLFSLLFLVLFYYSRELAFVVLIVVFLLDWADGLIARKYMRASDQGYIVDVMSDRISEALLFIPFFFPWFHLFSINCLLTLFSVKSRRHIILPLRILFIIYYAFLFFVMPVL